jgi:hypothetical protein
MSVVGPFLVVALVLVVSGAAKVISPWSAAAMLTAVAGRAVPPWAGRVVGTGEIVLGAVALTGWRPGAAAVGVAYLIFAAVAERARRRGVPSCGCFGATEAPPGTLHVILDLLSAAVALGAASITVDRSLLGTIDRSVTIAIGSVVALAAAVVLIIGAETTGAEVLAARRQLATVRPARGGHGR